MKFKIKKNITIKFLIFLSVIFMYFSFEKKYKTRNHLKKYVLLILINNFIKTKDSKNKKHKRGIFCSKYCKIYIG